MPRDLFSLFDDRLKSERDLVAGEPQTLESISEQTEEQERVIKKIDGSDTVKWKVDYSDFANFVFFNSALDYFNITGEKILNEYPCDGSVSDIEQFIQSLDGYQRYVLESWPARCGHLRFNPAVSSSYVVVEDVGNYYGVMRSSLMTPGTGSLSLEVWAEPAAALTGSSDAMVLVQKVTGSGDGYSMYLTGSEVRFRVVSGSTTAEVAAPFVGGQKSYFAGVYDSDVGAVSILTGSTTEFPVVVASSSVTFERFVLGTSPLTMASGSLASKTVRPYTGSLDQVSLWSVARSLNSVSSSFSTKTYAQRGLIGTWRFNESGSLSNFASGNAIVLDYSGHHLDGRIYGYYSGVRGSGSLIPHDTPDPILSFNAPEVVSFVYEQQTSGSLYDRENDNLITRLVPEKFLELEEEQGTELLKNFLYVIGRQFDEIKVGIDQFKNVLRVNYGAYDQVPDELLADIGKFYGWDFTGNFLNAQAFQYFVGKGVLSNIDSNKELDTKLYEIKNEFWRRTLANLSLLYKSKGTRESVESLLRIYGVDKSFVRLKEFGYKPNSGISTNRIHAEKSLCALAFGSGSNLPTPVVSSSFFNTTALSVEARVRFPTTSTTAMTASITTGSIWNMRSGSAFYHLYYTRDPASVTGSLYLSGSDGDLSLTSQTVFDGEWHNIAFVRNPSSGTISLHLRTLDKDAITLSVTASLSASLSYPSSPWRFSMGATGSYLCQHWAQEARVWDVALETQELDDHALNFQSYGVKSVDRLNSRALHWRLREQSTASLGGVLTDTLYDVSGRGGSVGTAGFYASSDPFKRFLFDYNYIAPVDYGWNEEKVRVYDGPRVAPGDAFVDNQVVALEFNMVDALNEDISQMLSSLDSFDSVIGSPANRFRDEYADLTALRRSYFSQLSGRLRFSVFADMLEFFDRSFVDMVRRLIPVSSAFVGDEFVVESHMLERPKLQWNYRRQERSLVIEGSLTVYNRT